MKIRTAKSIMDMTGKAKPAVKLLTALLAICLLFSFSLPFASALDAPRLKSADAYLVVDMKTGTEILSLNPSESHSIASLTKIMTCLLGVEAVESGQVSLTDMVTAQDDCRQGLDTSSSNAGITPGETMSFQDLLYCALVHSANDACNVIATHIAGSIPAFVKMMNDRAAELGCENTQFIDTDGMYNRSDGHYSCPRDLYKITAEAMNHPLFARICGTADYTVSATNMREAFEVHNSNALLSTGGIYGDSYVYTGVSGVKTGFTKPAGYCLVSVCERMGEQLMCIVLGCNGPLTYTFAGEYQNFEDSITIYDWAFANFESRTVFLAGEPLKRLSVTYAKDDGTVALCAAEDLKLFISKEIKDQDIVTEIHPYEDRLVAPITAGDELGYVDIYINNELRSTVRLLADADVEMELSTMIKGKILDFLKSTGFRIGVIAVIVIIVLFVVFRTYRKAAKRRILRARIAERDRSKWTEQKAAYAAIGSLRRQKKERTSGSPEHGRMKSRRLEDSVPPPEQESEQSRETRRRVPIETMAADRTPEEQWTQFNRPSAESHIQRMKMPQSPVEPQSKYNPQKAAEQTVRERQNPVEQTMQHTQTPEEKSLPRRQTLQVQTPVKQSPQHRDAPQAPVGQSVQRMQVLQTSVEQSLLRRQQTSNEHQPSVSSPVPRQSGYSRSAMEQQVRRKPVIHEGFHGSSTSRPAAVPEPEQEYDLEEILNSFK